MNILGSVLKMGGKWLEGSQERKTIVARDKGEIRKIEFQTKLATANAKLEMAKQGQSQDYDLDRIAMQNMQNSWKDEIIMGIFFIPIIMSFIPGLAPYTKAGFAVIKGDMPPWYIAIIIGITVVTYGMRGLLKTYLQHVSVSGNLASKLTKP